MEQTLKTYAGPRDDDSFVRDSHQTRQGYNLDDYQLYGKAALFDDASYPKPPRTLKQKKTSLVDEAIKGSIK